MRADLDAGEFWADRIKDYRGDPAERLALALKNLPLPAAFREAAIAVRALIRTKRKADEPFDEELTLLYWLAALRSFMVDYAPRLREPGYNVIETIPGQHLRSLRYKYSQLGYIELSLLNKTDIKWITAAWGEPDSHSTLHVLCKGLWDEYETKLIEQRKRADQVFRAELSSHLSADENPRVSQQSKPARTGCIMVVAVFVAGALGGCWWLGG
jgi:hypothetical protein